MESDIYTTAEERDKLNLMMHRFLIMGNFSKETGLLLFQLISIYFINV